MRRIIVQDDPRENLLQSPPVVEAGVQLLGNRQRLAEMAEVVDMATILHHDDRIEKIPLGGVVGHHLVDDALFLIADNNRLPLSLEA